MRTAGRTNIFGHERAARITVFQNQPYYFIYSFLTQTSLSKDMNINRLKATADIVFIYQRYSIKQEFHYNFLKQAALPATAHE